MLLQDKNQITFVGLICAHADAMGCIACQHVQIVMAVNVTTVSGVKTSKSDAKLNDSLANAMQL